MESAGAVPFSSSCGFLRSFHSLYPPYRFYGHTGIGSVWDFKGSNFSRRSGTSRQPVGNAPFPDHMEHPASSGSFWRSLRDRPILMRRRYAGLSTKPIADPYVLGISSGASAGAALALLSPLSVLAGQYQTAAFAFIGALFSASLVYSMAKAAGGGTIRPVAMLLSGTAVNAVMSAVTSFLIFPREESGKHCRRL